MRHRAGLLTVVAVLLAAAPAGAETTVDVSTSGHLAVAWHGDAARGCAAAGVCDITGSTTLGGSNDEVFGSSTGGSLLDLLSFEVGRSVIRVVRGAPDDPAGTCLDGTSAAELRVVPRRASAGHVRLALTSGFPPGGGLSAGRCAGPLAQEITAAMPVTTVASHTLRAPRMTLDFGGRRSFTAGPFSGTVSSTLKLHAHVHRTPSRGTSGSTDVGGGHAQRVVELQLAYRAAPVSGGLVSQFRGGPTPGCALLDACGLVGTYRLTLDKPFTFGVFAIAPARRVRPTLASMLAAVRSGRARVFPSSGPGQSTARAEVDITRDGAPACRDARPVDLPALGGHVGSKRLTLMVGQPNFAEPDDPLRTHCPGPARDPERDGALAAGSVPVARLGAPKITFTLTPQRVDDPDFTTTPAGSLTVELRRTTAKVRG